MDPYLTACAAFHASLPSPSLPSLVPTFRFLLASPPPAPDPAPDPAPSPAPLPSPLPSPLPPPLFLASFLRSLSSPPSPATLLSGFGLLLSNPHASSDPELTGLLVELLASHLSADPATSAAASSTTLAAISSTVSASLSRPSLDDEALAASLLRVETLSALL
ncbi:hypothetical protein TeGR_g2260, partial [Tetraparma gracilis]